MNVPPSPHFKPISLTGVFNADRAELPDSMRLSQDEAFGMQSYLGIPFELGQPGQPNVLLLDREEVRLELGEGVQATYIIFLHTVEDRRTDYLPGLADYAITGNDIGQLVSDYMLEYADGEQAATPIMRRLAIQQPHIMWGASPFKAVPALAPEVFPTSTEEQVLGRVASQPYGRGETRHLSGREISRENLWLYALPVGRPDQPIRRIIFTPRQERSLIYGISYTQVAGHPLQPGLRRKLQLALPEGARLNDLGEVEGIGLDLGTVISARAALVYDPAEWSSDRPNVQPRQSEDTVVVEYAAHPQARLYVATGPQACASYSLDPGSTEPAITAISPANRPVRLRVIDKTTRQPVAVRLHLHGEAGEYLAPHGHHRRVNPFWFEDNYAEFTNGLNDYCYILGDCLVDLPLGRVYVEISRGYEVAPIRASFEVGPQTGEVTFELERVLPWRERGWVTADTHVHFLSPQTALLEGQAEGVNVVNLLASQWGEMFSNVGDFDGRTTFGAREFGGDGEFLVRVGTENRMQVLGHISLLGYNGSMIAPLCTGGPSESAIGDPLAVTMAEWAEQCIRQGGLVVLPHAPDPQAERVADIVLGLVHAIEMMTFNPYFGRAELRKKYNPLAEPDPVTHNPFDAQINPYGLADWYRYLNLGYQLPVVGGSDKMSASSLLGGIRTYAQLGDRPFTYENWLAAVKAGNTFVTVGPLAELRVEGLPPGSSLELPAGGGTVNVTWQVESVRLPVEQVEVVMGGLTAEQVNVGQKLSAAGSISLRVSEPTWIALRVRGSYRGQPGEIAAHTSAVQVRVAGQQPFSPTAAMIVLEQIEGVIAYVDTIAPRPELQRYKQLRATLETAYNRLHQRMHQQGVYHDHPPLHDHEQ